MDEDDARGPWRRPGRGHGVAEDGGERRAPERSSASPREEAGTGAEQGFAKGGGGRRSGEAGEEEGDFGEKIAKHFGRDNPKRH